MRCGKSSVTVDAIVFEMEKTVSNAHRQQPTSMCVCGGFALFLFFLPLISDPGQLTIDWHWIRKTLKKKSKLFTIRCSQLTPKFISLFSNATCFVWNDSFDVLLCTHINQLQLSFRFAFCSIWLINLS